MKKQLLYLACIITGLAATFVSCNQQPLTTGAAGADSTSTASKYNGFESQAKWGEYIVNTTGCNDCHTPKKMGAHGPEDDTSQLLSGHPAQQPIPDIDRKMAEAKGLGVTNTETAWIGPWGVTFAANLTPDSTGIGQWTEEQFVKCLKQDKWMGMDGTRPLLPPMIVSSTSKMTDDALKAIFAYLKTLKPVHNITPAYLPPVTAMKK